MIQDSEECVLDRGQPGQQAVGAGESGSGSADIVEARAALRSSRGIHSRKESDRAAGRLSHQALKVNPVKSVVVADVELLGIVARGKCPGEAPALGRDFNRDRKRFCVEDAQLRKMSAPGFRVRESLSRMAVQKRNRRLRRVEPPHASESGIVDDKAGLAGAQMLRKVEAALLAGRPKMRGQVVVGKGAVAGRLLVSGQWHFVRLLALLFFEFGEVATIRSISGFRARKLFSLWG